MKKTLIAAAVMAVASLTATAQSTNLSVGYGGYTQMDCTDMHDGGKVNTAWGAVTAAADWQLAPRFNFGPSYTFSSSSYKHSDANIYYHVIMLNGRYTYYKNNIVNVYGHLGLGVDISHMTWGDNSKNKAYFAIQASPIGAEANIANNLKFYGELGFGAQGLLQVGLRVRL